MHGIKFKSDLLYSLKSLQHTVFTIAELKVSEEKVSVLETAVLALQEENTGKLCRKDTIFLSFYHACIICVFYVMAIHTTMPTYELTTFSCL